MKEETTPILLILFLVAISVVILLPRIVTEIEKLFYYSFGKIHFIHFHPIKKELAKPEKKFLAEEVPFYNKLSNRKKRSFEHRVASFVLDYDFHSRGEIPITREMKLLIAASAITLTFGFRDFTFSVLDLILIYPKTYTSKSTKRIHKGEFNPHLKTLVFSWEDFVKGNKVTDDNINLGIHEFTHVIHINSHKEKDINSKIFKSEFNALKKMIQNDASIKNKLTTSDYFRKYAFENHYEFMAVLIENFIETPEEFKSEFPQIYKRIKKMLNFNFLHY